MKPESIRITDTTGETVADISSGFGFNCYRLQVKHAGQDVDIIWSAPGFSEGTERPSGSGIPVLFPFPGRIEGTVFHWEGKDYSLPAGDGQGNAIHGFVHERPWRVIEQHPDQLVGQFQASLDDPQLLEHWPADFVITADYRVQRNQLACSYRVQNPGDTPLPYGLGTHPYFALPLGGSSVAACRLQLPVAERWELVEMIPTGRQLALEPDEDYRAGVALEDLKLDDIFTGLSTDGDQVVTSILDPGSGLRVTQSFDDSFPHCVVYTPPHREAICIEPYSMVSAAYQLEGATDRCGLRVLQPGEEAGFHVTIRFDR